MVYVGHEYHKKTKSVEFLIEIFQRKYNVYYMTYNDKTGQIEGDKDAFGKMFEVLVLFQMPVPVETLRKTFIFKHGAYFPMYDGTGEAPNYFWLDYKEFNIINFSRTLHERLLGMGLSSYYIQYFPKTTEHLIRGKYNKAFFWQRRDVININTVCDLLSKSTVKSIHLHKSVDPGQKYIEPTELQKKIYSFSYSTWYVKKEDMLEDVEDAGIYIAPREYEGIGMSFLEAMAMGKCVIAPNHPTMNEYIQSGFNGYLYDIYNVKPIDNMEVDKIQQNTFQYMQEGFKNWEKTKYDILGWLEKDVKINPTLMEKTYKEKFVIGKKYIGRRILLVTLEEGGIYRLFGKFKISKRIVGVAKIIRKKGT